MFPIVKQGGTVIMAASLTEGIGSPEFKSLFEQNANVEVFMQRILGKDYFVLDQWQLEKMAHVARKARLCYVTKGLSPEILSKLYVDSAPSVEQAVAEAIAMYGPNTRVAVVPKGPVRDAGGGGLSCRVEGRLAEARAADQAQENRLRKSVRLVS